MLGIFDLIFPKRCLLCKRKGKYICSICFGALPRTAYKQGAIVLLPYKGIVRKAILMIKYKFAYDVAKELSDLAVLVIRNSKLYVPKEAVLVPIPLHKKKEAFRGFNQVKEVGKFIAKDMGWVYAPDLLIRIVRTKAQANLNRKERAQNVKGAFRINPRSKAVLQKKPLILLDDVYTTGSTMREALKVLKEGGFKKVFPLALAG